MSVFHRIQLFSENNDERLAFSLSYLGEKLQKDAAKKIFRPLDISSVQYNVLCTLSVQSPRLSSTISPFILGSAANFSALLSRMEKEGLITREISLEDRREILVSWTEKGEETFKVVRKAFHIFFEEKFSKIPYQEKKQLMEVLQNFSEYI